ncbi:MAG: inosine-guanosine kinase [Methanohalophilus sp. T328-1]|nr:MAG: inosine-guanosine kinase [Methanohalophilus sp. T328-1]
MSGPMDVVGHAALDYLFEVEHIASPNESYPITSYEVLFGGGGSNIAAAMAQLGGNSRLVAAVGDDFSTSGYEQHLDNLGVDLSLLYHIEGEESTKAFVYTDPNHNQSSYWGSSSKLSDMETPALDFVHLAPSEASFSARVAQKSEFVSFDPGQDLVTYSKEHLITILDNTDILFANIHELKRVKEMTGRSFDDLKQSISTIVVTCDSSYHKNKKIDIPVVAVKAVDPTGAGDGYRAGFLLAFRKGLPFEVCGKIGSTVASFEVECVGCQTNLPTWGAMKKRYEENFGALPL